jgi:uncharacterized membrane protein YfcA
LIGGRWLYLIFGLILAYSAIAMLRERKDRSSEIGSDPLADRLRLHGEYYDPAQQTEQHYVVRNAPLGFGLMFIAGIVSGLLGIGSGALKVPAMDLAMGLPIKASTATSNFMIGVTAAASAGVYFSRGDIDPFIAGPVAAGVLLGAIAGSRVLGAIKARVIRILFVLLLLWVSAQMLVRGFE